MEKLGRYSIIGELGRGACGVVYRAHDPRIGRQVAIKTIATHDLREFPEGRQLYQRLCREAQSAGILSHPGIVTVHELDEDGDITYIVMEYVAGSTLRDRMGKGTLDRAQKLHVIEQTATALDYAHRNNVVHRDIKPANIMITEEGDVKIADFGVAKIVEAAGTTQTGVVGTPHYMSPEQIYAKGIDGRADQFSLAVVAYEMLAGKKPFKGDTLPSVIHQILHAEPAWEEDLRELGAGVADVMRRALAKDPKGRFSTCHQFAAALRVAVEEGVSPLELTTTMGAGHKLKPVVAPTPRPPWWRLPALVAAAVFVVAAVTMGYRAGISRRDTRPAPPRATQTAAPAPPQPQPVAATPVVEAPKKQVTTEPARRKEPEKRVETAKVEPPPAPAPPAAKPEESLPVVAAVPAGSYHGPPEGRFTWSGSLRRLGTVAIAASRSTIGAIAGRGLPPGLRVVVEVSPTDLRIVEQPSADNGFRLTIGNPTDREIAQIAISWREAAR